MGEYEQINTVIMDIKNKITEYKNEIINDKNKLLFGLITTANAITNYDSNKEMFNDLISLQEIYVKQWNETIDNPDNQTKLDEAIAESYIQINKIKDYIRQMNETNPHEPKFAKDAVDVYKQLIPLFETIRNLKYGENFVYHDYKKNTFHLIQNKNKLVDLNCSIGLIKDEVIAYDVGGFKLEAKGVDSSIEKFIKDIKSNETVDNVVDNVVDSIGNVIGNIVGNIFNTDNQQENQRIYGELKYNKAPNKMNTLINKIYKFLNPKDKVSIKELIYKSTESNIENTFKSIWEIVNTSVIIKKIAPDENRQEYIVDKLYNYISTRYNKTLSDLKMVDIGGGNGNVVSGLADKMKGQKENYICLETKTDWAETYKYDNQNITYQFWDNTKVPIADATMDVVLCMVTLHHMTDETIQTTLTEIMRILKPGGLLLIKEHDYTPESKEYIIWEHNLYHILDVSVSSEQTPVDPAKYFKNNINNFKGIQVWKDLIGKTGLNWNETFDRFLVGELIKDDKNISNLYWDVYIKPAK
jgi:ubiquinone/menaquinone biosynthesis C-methylase UbiE